MKSVNKKEIKQVLPHSAFSKNRKAQIEMSFGWIFAIVVGAAILVLAIYGVTKAVKTSSEVGQTAGAKELGVLLNPLEIGFESASSTPLKTTLETKIYNKCYTSGNFGKQGISLSEFSFNKWQAPGAEVSFENKYIFSNKTVEGKNFYVFSKPFEFPFKVADIIILTSANDKYCFDKAPLEIEDEISQINQANLAPNCTNKTGYTKICFNEGTGCKIINVDYNRKIVTKGKDTFYFVGDGLMYAAIFSDKDVYDCQVQRLAKRTKELAVLYKEKALLLTQRGCETNLEGELDGLISQLDLTSSSELSGINVENIKSMNDNSRCPLW
jgi:hypothetical protein